MLSRKPTTLFHKHTKIAAAVVAAAAIAIGGGAYGIVSATASTGSGAASAATLPSATSGRSVVGDGGGSNARSGPAAGGSSGTVDSVSKSSFTISTSAAQTVTVKKVSATRYEVGTRLTSASAVTKGESVLVLGITSGTTITASQVIVEPADSVGSTAASGVVPFQRGAASTSQQVGQIPADYSEGSGTIVSGTAANKATKAALAAYPGGIVDRVVKLSNGEYEVHNIGVNWPHHIFVNQDFKVIGAE
jgi:hypothetical protein